MAGWRGLGLFWVVVLLLVGSGAATLQALGPVPQHPVEAPPQAAAAAPEPEPANGMAPLRDALLEPAHSFTGMFLPKIGANGAAARIVYARAFDRTSDRPRIALVLTGFGESEVDSRNAVQNLPGPIDFAVTPYVGNVDALLQLCRTAGHETLVSIPLEPAGFPLNDAGSRSLLTGAPQSQNNLNLEWALSRFGGYAGAIGALDGMRGERFADQTSSWTTMLAELSRRGLLYIDPRPGHATDAVKAVPGREVDLVIDDPPARAEIEAKLLALERIARDHGSALGLAGPLRPATVERIAAWAKGLPDRGIDLAPASALIAGAGR